MVDFNFCFFGILRGSTLRFERSFSWSTTLYLNLSGRGVQGSTEGGFLPSAEAKAEGAKKLQPSAKDQSRRFQMIEVLNLFA